MAISSCFVRQNLVEFWNVCTRPFPARDRRRPFEWRRLVVAYSVAGVQVHDARLIAAMLAHGILQLLALKIAIFGHTPISVVDPRDVVPAIPGQ